MFTEQKFKVFYDDYLNSGLTIRDYCANHQMNEAKFYYWQNKLKGQLPPRRGFVPILFEQRGTGNRQSVAGTSTTASPAYGHPLSCEINYPNGVCVKLHGLSCPEELGSLLALMRG